MGKDEGADGCPFLKSAYYTGKLLHAADFVREQKYGNDKLEFLNRKFYGWGIIEGLEIQPGRNGGLYLSRGSAIDPRGRILTAPEGRRLEAEGIEGLHMEAGNVFILGMEYAEQTLETERDYTKKEEYYQPAVIAETYSLKAYGKTEFRELMDAARRYEGILTEERILYENGAVALALRIPKIVPVDSLFRMSIRMRSLQGNTGNIGWRGKAKLQGAVFAQTGEPFLLLEEKPAVCSGSLKREWDIYTEENRKFPVSLEISELEIVAGDTESTEIPACRFSIETAVSYEKAVKGYLRRREGQAGSRDWVPLACLRVEEASGQGGENGKYTLSLMEEDRVRFHVPRPYEDEALGRIMEENGILDIRWRKLLKCAPPFPPDVPSGSPEPPLTEARFWELTDAEREGRIRRGIIVIPIPRRYRRGQVLLSEEISHGFPGEEVFLSCARVWEERSYAYWEHGKKRYKIVHGEEELFADRCDGYCIHRQAVLQNVEGGTFQVALTLKKQRRRNRGREVAVSWIAVKSV